MSSDSDFETLFGGTGVTSCAGRPDCEHESDRKAVITRLAVDLAAFGLCDYMKGR